MNAHVINTLQHTCNTHCNTSIDTRCNAHCKTTHHTPANMPERTTREGAYQNERHPEPIATHCNTHCNTHRAEHTTHLRVCQGRPREKGQVNTCVTRSRLQHTLQHPLQHTPHRTHDTPASMPVLTTREGASEYLCHPKPTAQRTTHFDSAQLACVSCHTRHVTHVQESCHTCEVMSHIYNVSCHPKDHPFR